MSFVILALVMTATSARAQEPGAAASAAQRVAARGQVVPLEVQVVISKFQGDKKVSSIPYVLTVNATTGAALNSSSLERTQMTIGSEVPVPTTTFTQADGKAAQPLRSFNYRNVGTTMTVAAVVPVDDPRYELDLSIDESSVGTSVSSAPGQVGDMPVFKSFKTRNRLILRNGQTRQFTAATDRISGETVRIEVTLTVVK
jgi:hypothetical protein